MDIYVHIIYEWENLHASCSNFIHNILIHIYEHLGEIYDNSTSGKNSNFEFEVTQCYTDI